MEQNKRDVGGKGNGQSFLAMSGNPVFESLVESSGASDRDAVQGNTTSADFAVQSSEFVQVAKPRGEYKDLESQLVVKVSTVENIEQTCLVIKVNLAQDEEFNPYRTYSTYSVEFISKTYGDIEKGPLIEEPLDSTRAKVGEPKIRVITSLTSKEGEGFVGLFCILTEQAQPGVLKAAESWASAEGFPIMKMSLTFQKAVVKSGVNGSNHRAAQLEMTEHNAEYHQAEKQLGNYEKGLKAELLEAECEIAEQKDTGEHSDGGNASNNEFKVLTKSSRDDALTHFEKKSPCDGCSLL